MEPQDTSSTATIDSTELRTELLGRLGLPPEATDADIAAAHRAAKNLLEHAPDEQKAWAADQLADVEAVTSLLADLPESTPTAAAAVGASAGSAVAAPAVRRHVPRWVWAAAAVVVVAGVAFGMHAAGSSTVPGITGTPTDSSSSSASALDQAQVGALMQKITANPKDTTSLASLAAMYFQAADYKNSALFSQKVLAVDPKQVVSWVALGAAQFNEGDQTSAKQSWLKAIALNPKNVEAHYDLGFLYLSGSKPDVAAAKKEWSTVIAIDPKSDIAKTVQTHLSSLSSASPSPSTSK
jgi:tetratricopeptide (TPR) repeat protein